MNSGYPAAVAAIRPRSLKFIVGYLFATEAWKLIYRVCAYCGVYLIPTFSREETPMATVINLAIMLLHLAAATSLWLLQKRAVTLLLVAFFLSDAGALLAFRAYGSNAPELMQGKFDRFVTFLLVVRMGVSLAICIYAWRLRQRGVLR